jgi:hypothetical protein
MSKKVSRRKLFENAAAAGMGYLIPAAHGSTQPSSSIQPASNSSSDRILPLTSNSDVYIPPRGESFFKFSFDFPEPSVEFEGLVFSFRLYTFENVYGLDRGLMELDEKEDGLEIRCSQWVWAGGQQKAPGRLTARLRRNGSFIECAAVAKMEQPIKSIAAIVRGVPRGRISAGGAGFTDHGDDEVLLGYPFGGGSLFTAQTFNTPLAVIQSGERDYFFLSALNEAVRANRFYFQPGEKAYRVELVYEREGWYKSNELKSPVWRLGKSAELEGAFRPHFEHVERVFSLKKWDEREDVPSWVRRVALVVTPHGMHWTGYVFNDFAKTRRILEWIAAQIPGERVLVFLPAWDGRYYWNYPLYKSDPRLGGEEGFAELIRAGQKMGFHLMPMFGINAANDRLPEFSRFSDAAARQIDGDPFYLNWVDWDNDRHFEGSIPYMNVGVASWREWLAARIEEVIRRYRVDAYFLDIAGGWENNTQADPHLGTRLLVTGLRDKHPNVLCCGEMHYDALLGFIPLYQAYQESAYPEAVTRYAREFQHLSHPAPGRGSSGVHESGYSRFDPVTLSLSDRYIPTITIVDDTFDKYRDVMAAIIARAKQRAGIA